MLAKVTLTCSKCGRDFEMTHGVETQEEKEQWEQWAKETYKSPYCPECRDIKGEQLDTMKGVGGGFAVAADQIKRGK